MEIPQGAICALRIQSIQCMHSIVKMQSILCIQVMLMKKIENITFRTDKETKEALLKIATGKKWSLSLLVEDIVQEWLDSNNEKTSSKEN